MALMERVTAGKVLFCIVFYESFFGLPKMFLGYDLALLQLYPSLKEDQHFPKLKPVCLPYKNKKPSGGCLDKNSNMQCHKNSQILCWSVDLESGNFLTALQTVRFVGGANNNNNSLSPFRDQKNLAFVADQFVAHMTTERSSECCTLTDQKFTPTFSFILYFSFATSDLLQFEI